MVDNNKSERNDGVYSMSTLGFDPALYGIDVDHGIVEGRRVGVAAAVIRAIASHKTAQSYGHAPETRVNGHLNGYSSEAVSDRAAAVTSLEQAVVQSKDG